MRRYRAGVSMDNDTTPEWEQPDVAVIIPTRNRARLLHRLLRQLAGIPGDLRYEIIVVDEGSSDETPDLLREIQTKHPLIVVRHDPPRGLSGARNAGFRRSTARYIAWIDDDDLTSPERLARQHAALVGGVARWSCSGRIDVDDELRVIGHARCPQVDALLPSVLRSNVLPSAAQGLLVERHLVEEVGPFDESLTSAEDWDFAIRLLEVGPPHLLDEPLVGYRTGVESMSTDTDRMETMIAQVIEKHRSAYAAAGVQPDWAAIHQSLLPGDLLRGRQRAVRRAWRSLRARPTLGSLRRLAAVSLAPARYGRVSAERRRALVPAVWVEIARGWLEDVENS